jgi:hypothetical protein
LEHRVVEPVASVDAKCTPSTDAGLTPSKFLASISDDRLFTAAEICSLLRIRRTDVYRACDQGSLEYVKFEGAVQVEGRDLKRWVLASGWQATT